MIFSDDGTPLSDIGDMSIYSAFSPSLFSSPRPAINSASSPRTEEALTVLADSCIASAEKDYSSSRFEGNDNDSPNISRIRSIGDGIGLENVSFVSIADLSAVSNHELDGSNSPLDVTGTQDSPSQDSPSQDSLSPSQESVSYNENSISNISNILGTATKRKHYSILEENDGSDSMIMSSQDQAASVSDSPFKSMSLSTSGITDKDFNDSITSFDDSCIDERDGNILFKRSKTNFVSSSLVLNSSADVGSIGRSTRTKKNVGDKDEASVAMHALLAMQQSSNRQGR